MGLPVFVVYDPWTNTAVCSYKKICEKQAIGLSIHSSEGGKGHQDITALSSHCGLQQNYIIWPLVTIKNVVNGILFLPKMILAFSGYIQSHEAPSSTRDRETPVRHRQQTQRTTI